MKRKPVHKKPTARPPARHGLIDDWKQCYKLMSVWFAAAMAASAGLYEFLPTVREYIGESLFHYLMAGLAILTIMARVKKQA